MPTAGSTDPGTVSARLGLGDSAQPTATPGPGLTNLLVGAVLVYSFVFCFESGRRGFFALDQSIAFDGAYRILSGQVPYKDFLIPIGPGVFCLQALFFKLFGVNFTAYLLGAAVPNLLATALAMFTVWTLFPVNHWPAIIAGFLTATWFYPPYGTPNMEQTAFLFAVIGIACAIATVRPSCRSGTRRAVLCLLTGVCVVLAFLSKQNAGLLIAPLYAVLLLVINVPRLRDVLIAVGWWLCGVSGAAAAFALWLILASDPTLFQKHFFTLPGEIGVERITGARPVIFNRLLAGNGSFLPTTMLFASAMALTALVLILRRRVMIAERAKPVLAAILCLYLQLFQNAFAVTTGNQWQECMPFVGLVLGCASGLMALLFEQQLDARFRIRYGWPVALAVLAAGYYLSYFSGARAPEIAAGIFLLFGGIIGMFGVPWQDDSGTAGTSFHGEARRAGLGFFIGIFLVGCAIQGIRTAWTRSVHDIFHGAEFVDVTSIEGLERLKWGNPTEIYNVDFTSDDLTKVVNRLKSKNRPFFVFPEYTILYGLLGVPSPQPLLWFHGGLTFPYEHDEPLDQWIVDALVRAEVELIVLQETCFFGAKLCSITDFPLLKEFIRQNFVLDEQFGGFNILRKQVAAQASPR